MGGPSRGAAVLDSPPEPSSLVRQETQPTTAARAASANAGVDNRGGAVTGGSWIVGVSRAGTFSPAFVLTHLTQPSRPPALATELPPGGLLP